MNDPRAVTPRWLNSLLLLGCLFWLAAAVGFTVAATHSIVAGAIEGVAELCLLAVGGWLLNRGAA